MASFVVLAPQQDGQRNDDRTVFIRDGFAFLALVFTIPWLLVHRLWFEAAAVFGLMIALSTVGSYTGREDMAAVITALLSLLVAFEGNNWRVAALERRGFDALGVVDARNTDDAETAWFLGDNIVSPPAVPVITRPAPPAQVSHKPALGGRIGLVGLRGEN
ncbi:DUF2628 domain-containing protein [Phyllobacterium endophyticum]|uniref:DUF2628 domain-containing protein n=1 Tax=Phyllobacterium endophyticum TaxID=1149773 RepID=UPI0011CC8E9A|nr:DUF2628 domain-containing protein [Phyllobacterium endophyticum]TXR50226.1 DUF2628 domain-containing protein [Phyllobacterium endophyticum]